MTGRSVLSVDQFSRTDLETVFAAADAAKRVVESSGSCEACKGKILANAFYEPSTRTMCSFAAAMYRLGGNVLAINASTSSVKKGETLGDTVRSLECYSDVVVLRHPVKGSAAEADAALQCPLQVCRATTQAATAVAMCLWRWWLPALVAGRWQLVALASDR